jgi:heptosyltransferase-2
VVAINPGATNSRAKRWLAERFAATADRLAERDGFQTVIVGAAGDIEAADETARLMRSPALVLAGKTDIAELKAVLASAALVVSNEHRQCACFCGAWSATVVGVFGPTEHESTRPYSDIATVVRHDVECSLFPHVARLPYRSPLHEARVEVDDVYRAAKDLLVSAVR